MDTIRNYMHFLVMEIYSITNMHAEIFDYQKRLLASSFDSPGSAGYCLLPTSIDEGFQLVSIKKSTQSALFMPVNSGGEQYLISVIGEKDKLLLLYKPIKEIIKLHIEKETLSGGNAIKSVKTAFFEELLLNETVDDSVIRQSVSLNVDLRKAHFITVVSMCIHPSEHSMGLGDFSPQMEKWLLNEAERLLPAESSYAFPLEQRRIVIITGNAKLDTLKKSISGMLDNALERYSCAMCAGISYPTGGYGDFHRAYENAASICRLAYVNKGPGVYFQGDFSSELLIDCIPYEMKKNFTEHFFSGCADADIDEWDKIVQVLYDNNGSIGKSSEKLFVHKNTLQYRLGRIKERTGFDARISNEALTLQLAFLVRKNMITYKNP